MKENEFASKLTRALRKCNAEVLSVVGNRMQASAWPDIYVAHTYWTGWIEFKGEKTLLRNDQKIMIERLIARNVYAFVVRYPNRIQNSKEILLSTFTTFDAADLLRKLRDLSCQTSLF